MLTWADRFNIFCFLDNNDYHFEAPAFEAILAVGSKRSIRLKEGSAYADLHRFYDNSPGWLFGHLGYGLKNETELLALNKTAPVDFGIGFFFEPEILIRIHSEGLSIEGAGIDAAVLFETISNITLQKAPTNNMVIRAQISRESYLAAVIKLKEHIRRGDCYELNYCQHFYAENTGIDAVNVYTKLLAYSPNPFAALYKLDGKYCLCASPERYLKKQGRQLISQPIKGTSRRDFTNGATDAANKSYLQENQKEKSENVMVVDLVRNDLSKICEEGSVHVKELFGVYSFPQVHQMISTIEGTVPENLHWVDAIKATFPMGSMTGAPKKKVMELIDTFEVTGRGLFSGAIGYVDPEQNFDFNVVIRSIFYDEAKQLVSFSAGSGLTFYSDPEAEYEECMLKAAAIRSILERPA
ncbi:MAG: anthranilate synthase component family protein [Ferruginibacter sp.]|nr:anthranilate synthase component family protein [Ferruginibacter sp.]